MVYRWCIVPLCKNTSIATPSKTFISVPLEKKMRNFWIRAVRRDPKEFSSTSGLYVCEDHFNEDMENYLEWKTMGVKKRMKKTVVPHIFECQPDRKRTLTQPTRSAVAKRRKLEIVKDCLQPKFTSEVNTETVEMNMVPLCESKLIQEKQISVGVQVHIKLPFRSKAVQCALNKPVNISNNNNTINYTNNKKNVAVQTVMPKLIAKKLSKQSVVTNTSESSLSDFSKSSPSNSSESNAFEVQFRRELQGKQSLKHSIYIIEKNPRRYLGILEEVMFIVKAIKTFTGLDITSIYITLKKIRTDATFRELGDDFGLSEGTVSKIFSKSIGLISQVLSQLIVWPSGEKIKKMLPLPFRARYSKVQSIIDCLEIEIQKPQDSVKQAFTWSEYKKANTIKYLISSTPDGLINFISTGFGGRASDALIFEKSGFLEKLRPGTHVMADRGFKHIDKLLADVNCMLVRPPSTKMGEKMSNALQTKKIASLRVHIERVIRRVREFKILKPHSSIHSKLIPYMDYMMTIACGLINTQGPLISE